MKEDQFEEPVNEDQKDPSSIVSYQPGADEGDKKAGEVSETD